MILEIIHALFIQSLEKLKEEDTSFALARVDTLMVTRSTDVSGYPCLLYGTGDAAELR